MRKLNSKIHNFNNTADVVYYAPLTPHLTLKVFQFVSLLNPLFATYLIYIYIYIIIIIIIIFIIIIIRVQYGLMVIYGYLHITLPHYRHYADLSEGIELLKCLSDIVCVECVSKMRSVLSSIFHTIYGAVCIVFSLPIPLMMIVRRHVLNLIIIVKSKI